MRHMVCLSLLRFGTFSRRCCFSASSSDIDSGRKICFLGGGKKKQERVTYFEKSTLPQAGFKYLFNSFSSRLLGP